MAEKTRNDASNLRGVWPEKVSGLLLLSLPLVLFLYLYAPAANFEFVWLDRMEIQGGGGILPPGDWLSAFTRPVHVGSGGSSGSNPFYRPLQLLVTNSVYRTIGPSAFGFHVVALIFGGLTITGFTFLAWLLFRRVMPALIAGLVAAAHPAGIEPYVWVSAMSESMSALFIIISLVGAKLYFESSGANLEPLKMISWMALVAAMMSKEKGVITPVLLLFMVADKLMAQEKDARDTMWDSGRGIRRRARRLIVAQFIAVLAFFFVLRHLVVGPVGGITPIGGSLQIHWLTALASWPETLFWFAFPLQSTSSDVVDVVSSISDYRVWLGMGLLLASLLAWYVLLKVGRTVSAFGLAWVWLAFLPTANLVPMLHAHAERYMYLSVFGLALFIAGLMPSTGARKRSLAYQYVATGFMLVPVILLAGRTQDRVPDWTSTESLFSHDVERDPYYREGIFYLAVSKFDNQRHREVDRYLDELIPLVENYPGKASYITHTDVFELACINSLASRRPGRAIKQLERGMRSLPEISQDVDIVQCMKMAREASGS